MEYRIEDMLVLALRRIRPDKLGCWIWTGSVTTGKQYGRLRSGPRSLSPWVAAHRLMYHLWRDRSLPLRPGPGTDQQIDHLCRNTRCVNPAHMEVVSVRLNVQRGDLGLRGDFSSPYLGVRWREHEQRWLARIRYDGRRIDLGLHRFETDAAAAYNYAQDLLGIEGIRNPVNLRPEVVAKIEPKVQRFLEKAA